MAIFHLSVKPISRSAGRSATAAAAYRAGEKILDERTGEIHDYARRGGVETADLVLPDGAPKWASDRAKLWNAAELAEKRKDACVAREFEVALPAELSPAERRDLVLDFARGMANREGCAVDVAIHSPGRGGDNRNHHAHILRTTRKVEADGLGAKLDTEKAGRKRAEDLEAVRARWAELTNAHLERAGVAERIDHRSLKAQAIEREPTQHLGPAATGYERRTGEPSDKRIRQEQQADERLAQVELGQLERQREAAADAIEDIEEEIEGALIQHVEERFKALRERRLQFERDLAERAEEHRIQAERQRIERMSAAELAAGIERLRPPSVAELVERDPDVVKAAQELERWREASQKGRSKEHNARDDAQQWREQNPKRAWLHDKGIGHSPQLRELEQLQKQGHQEWLKAAPRLEDAAQRHRDASDYARGRIRQEQAPLMLKLDALEKLRQEKARQELEQQQRHKAEKAAQRALEALPKDFASMALKREMKASGWSDRGEQWQAAPEGLKALVKGYNALPKEMRPAALERILESDRKREQVRGLMDEQREQYRENDRGISL